MTETTGDDADLSCPSCEQPIPAGYCEDCHCWECNAEIEPGALLCDDHWAEAEEEFK